MFMILVAKVVDDDDDDVILFKLKKETVFYESKIKYQITLARSFCVVVKYLYNENCK